MKKIILVLIVFLFACGCGKKLECTYNENYEDIKIQNKITFNFKNNTYEQIDKMIFNDKKDAENYFNDISDYKEEYNLTLENKTIISRLNGVIKLNKKEIKKEYENYDYRCK